MPPNLTREIRWARCMLWWQRNDGIVYVVLFCLFSAVAGGFTMALYDRAERIELMRQHGDEIGRFRQSCRAVIDERDEKVRESTGAAAAAATAAGVAAEAAAAASLPDEPPPKRPAAAARPGPDLGAAVRSANRLIEGGPR